MLVFQNLHKGIRAFSAFIYLTVLLPTELLDGNGGRQAAILHAVAKSLQGLTEI